MSSYGFRICRQFNYNTNVKTETYFDRSDAAGVQREGADS